MATGGSPDRSVGVMKPVGLEPQTAPRIFIAAPAFKRLALYIELCPFEVSGLGTVEPIGRDLLVTEVFLIRQRASDSDTELDPQAVGDHLLETVQKGGDPTALRLWWHSHGGGPIFWSETDEETIAALQIDQLVSIVGNKRREFGCRLDRFMPQRLTVEGLPLVPLQDAPPEDGESLRRQIMVELREKVTLIQREVSMVPEIFLDPSCVMEIAIPFDEPEPPQRQ